MTSVQCQGAALNQLEMSVGIPKEKLGWRIRCRVEESRLLGGRLCFDVTLVGGYCNLWIKSKFNPGVHSYT